MTDTRHHDRITIANKRYSYNHFADIYASSRT